MPFIDQHPYFCALIDDPRIEGLAGDILGYDFNYSNSDGNFYVGDTGWHSDLGHASPYLTMKIAFYLDEVTKDSGCLRVIPGSHTSDDSFASTLNDMMPSMKEFTTEESLGVAGQDIPATALETKPGDLVVFDRRIKHASFGGGNRRRMFTMVLEQRYAEDDMPELRRKIGTLSRWWMERAYGPTMIERPRTQRPPTTLEHLEGPRGDGEPRGGIQRQHTSEGEIAGACFLAISVCKMGGTVKGLVDFHEWCMDVRA